MLAVQHLSSMLSYTYGFYSTNHYAPYPFFTAPIRDHLGQQRSGLMACTVQKGPSVFFRRGFLQPARSLSYLV